MKIFKQSEIDEAAEDIEYNKGLIHSNPRLLSSVSFTSGVKYAESKVEEIAIEFIEWIMEDDYVFTTFGENRKQSNEFFQQFLKERNNE
jgi:hypothetical protein